ncbi:hypothetical protein, partial [Streptomyces bluensis]|uniref:hypothetical protein n=1 Tax=Streptomyces bluensis TaxID=33897 RepID=UPI00332D1728
LIVVIPATHTTHSVPPLPNERVHRLHGRPPGARMVIRASCLHPRRDMVITKVSMPAMTAKSSSLTRTPTGNSMTEDYCGPATA